MSWHQEKTEFQEGGNNKGCEMLLKFQLRWGLMILIGFGNM